MMIMMIYLASFLVSNVLVNHSPQSRTDSTHVYNAKELFELGMEHARKRDFLLAKNYFDRAILKDSMLVDAIFRRGLVYDNMGLTHEAIEDYTKAIGIEARAVFYNNRAINKAILGFFNDAINDYDEALKLRPDYGDAFINRGYALAEIGRLEEACSDFLKAQQLGHFMAIQMLEDFCE